MKRKLFGCLAAVMAAWSLQAEIAQSDEEVFGNTVKQIDLGGTYLNYVNTAGMAQLIENMVDAFCKLPSMLDGSQADAQIGANIKLFFQICNFNAYKSYAVSCKKDPLDQDVFVYKSFTYTSPSPRGLFFDALPRENRSFAMAAKIPDNAILAAGGYSELGRAWNYLSSEIGKSGNAFYKGMLENMPREMEKNTGIKLPELLKSISGEYFILITMGDPAAPQSIRGMLSVPDADGVLTKYLKENLTASQMGRKVTEDIYLIGPPELPPVIAPQIIFETGRVTLVSHPDILSDVKNAAANPVQKGVNAKYFLNAPEQGLGYFYLNIDQKLVRHLSSMAAISQAEEMIKALCNYPVFYGVSTVAPLGYSGYVRSNVSVVQLSVMMPSLLTASMVMPAISRPFKAPERGDSRIKCVNNLKQLMTCLAAYSMDHDGDLPKANNEIGIAALSRGYLPPVTAPVCPTTWLGYYYLGGMKINPSGKMDIAADMTPVLFDRKSHHGVVSVAFLSGRVKSLPIGDYKDPADVIKVLNEKYKYPPELLDKLLKICETLNSPDAAAK